MSALKQFVLDEIRQHFDPQARKVQIVRVVQNHFDIYTEVEANGTRYRVRFISRHHVSVEKLHDTL